MLRADGVDRKVCFTVRSCDRELGERRLHNPQDAMRPPRSHGTVRAIIAKRFCAKKGAGTGNGYGRWMRKMRVVWIVSTLDRTLALRTAVLKISGLTRPECILCECWDLLWPKGSSRNRTAWWCSTSASSATPTPPPFDATMAGVRPSISREVHFDLGPLTAVSAWSDSLGFC